MNTTTTQNGEVWCARCPEAATMEVRLASGETRSLCKVHYRELVYKTRSTAWTRQPSR